jgi:VCBS repeat-containing protein
MGIGSGNGIELWTFNSDNTNIPPVGAGRLIFFPGSNNKIVAVDAFDGKSVYEDNIGSKITTTLAISNGRIIFGTESGKILILGSTVYDFNLKISPEIQTVNSGSSVEYTIEINMTDGFKDPISFSVTGFPCSCKGVSRYFDKSSIIPPDNKIKLIIDTTMEAEPAKYVFSITAYSGRDLKREATGTIIVQKDTAETELSVTYPSIVKAGEDFIASIFIQNGKNIRSANFLFNFPTDLLYIKDAFIGGYFSDSVDKLLIDKSLDNINGNISFGVTKRDLGESRTG